jgi:tRNA G18 (ribose-2'-O)-methylase SpoU
VVEPNSNVIEVDNLDHELLAPYRDLRTRNWTRQSGRFIAEGPLLVERLLRSGYSVESVLLDRKFLDSHAQRIPASVPVVVVDHEFIPQLVGFNFHRGVLGCGRRPEPKRLNRDLEAQGPRETWLALVGVQDPENVGAMLRSAAGLGIRRILIGPGTADPLSRRALRVSMGAALRLETFYSSDLRHDMELLKDLKLECVATVLDHEAEVLDRCSRTGPMVIFVGNERNGLPEELIPCMDRKVTIPMDLATDSLNVAIAASIAMHYFSRIL